jgi:hypothetical protein
MSFFDKFKEKGAQAAQKMGLMTRVAKLRVEVATQKSEKERHLKTIGEKTYGIFARDKKLEAANVEAEITNELSLIERIESHLEELESQIRELQAEIGSTDKSGVVVDADDVKESDDDDDEDDEEDDE